MKKDKHIFLILFIFIITILILFVSNSNTNFKYYNDGLLYINEVMSNNKFTILDNYNKHPDYIEIYNGYDYDINLEGYYLSDKDNYNNKWKFPKIYIKSKSYLLVYASSKDICDIEKGICHTNFKLSDNEVVTLTNKDNKVISKIKYNKSASDTSYGYNGKEYVYYYVGTPLKDNDTEYTNKPIERKKSDVKLRINEYSNNNKSILKDYSNEYYSIVELYNYGNNDINIKDYYLTNKENNLIKYKFDDITIKSNEYLLLYLSGKESKENEVHVDFEIDTSDTTLILLDKKLQQIDKVDLKPLPINMSSVFYEDKWHYTFETTFGKENTSKNIEDKLPNSNISTKNLIINEVTNDRIELKNISNESINLKDYAISGNSSKIMKFPSIVMKPNSYYVIYESSNYSYSSGKLYIGFKISNTNEKINLYDNYNNIVDTFTSGKLYNSNSYGINEKGEKVVFTSSTMGYNNSNTYYKGYAKPINFSIDGGYVDKNTEVELTSNDGGTIYYTTDGSFPTNKSKKYENKITINDTTTIKAIEYKDDYLPSDVVSRTYFVGRKYDLPIVSISANNSDLFGYYGLFNNYRADMEEKISFEFYESDGSLGVMFNGGVKFVGQDSREYPQKSLAVYLRNRYGLDEISYPFFLNHNVTTFSSFTLRNSGEDVTFLKIKDIFIAEVLRNQMDLDFQYYRPIVVYINDKYYGLYNMREKINEAYLSNNHNVDRDNVTIIKGNDDVRSGSIDDYENLLNYALYHNLANKEDYEYVKSRVDIQELINYWVVQTYIRNTDTGNIRCWKENVADGKWRWVLFDLDWGLWPTTYGSPSLFYPFEPYGHGTGNSFSTLLTYKLWKNNEFRQLYLETFAYHLKNTFNPDRMIKILDQIVDMVDNEMPYHVDRWYNDFINDGKNPLTIKSWNSNIETMKKVIKDRYNIVKNSVRSEFNLSNDEYNKYFKDI